MVLEGRYKKSMENSLKWPPFLLIRHRYLCFLFSWAVPTMPLTTHSFWTPWLQQHRSQNRHTLGCSDPFHPFRLWMQGMDSDITESLGRKEMIPIRNVLAVKPPHYDFWSEFWSVIKRKFPLLHMLRTALRFYLAAFLGQMRPHGWLAAPLWLLHPKVSITASLPELTYVSSALKLSFPHLCQPGAAPPAKVLTLESFL